MMARRAALTTLALCFAALVAACTSSGGPQPEARGAGTLFPNASIATRAMENTAEFQQGLLADGKVTLAEYESAFFAFVACVKEAGLTFGDEPVYNQGKRRFDYGIKVGRTEEVPANESKIGRCGALYLYTVQTAWDYQNRPTEADIQRGDALWRECMLKGGMDASDVAALPDWRSDGFAEMRKVEAQNAGPQSPIWLTCSFEASNQVPGG